MKLFVFINLKISLILRYVIVYVYETQRYHYNGYKRMLINFWTIGLESKLF